MQLALYLLNGKSIGGVTTQACALGKHAGRRNVTAWEFWEAQSLRAIVTPLSFLRRRWRPQATL